MRAGRETRTSEAGGTARVAKWISSANSLRLDPLSAAPSRVNPGVRLRAARYCELDQHAAKTFEAEYGRCEREEGCPQPCKAGMAWAYTSRVPRIAPRVRD